MKKNLPSNVKVIENISVLERHLNSGGLHLTQRGFFVLVLILLLKANL